MAMTSLSPRRYQRLIDLPIIASGGAGTAAHIYDGFVDGKADACLAASIFHFQGDSHSFFETILTGARHSSSHLNVAILKLG